MDTVDHVDGIFQVPSRSLDWRRRQFVHHLEYVAGSASVLGRERGELLWRVPAATGRDEQHGFTQARHGNGHSDAVVPAIAGDLIQSDLQYRTQVGVCDGLAYIVRAGAAVTPTSPTNPPAVTGNRPIQFFWPEGFSLPSEDAGYTNGRAAWILQTFRHLESLGWPVELTTTPSPDHILVAHHDDLAVLGLLVDNFVVGIRADRERVFLADVEIVQSPASIESRRHFYMPHWPQRGIRPRAPARGDRLENVGYFGEIQNLGAEFRGEDFRAALAAMGYRLLVRNEPEQWTQYTDVDVVLAVRDGQLPFLNKKPASKLFNAWLADCPALVGDEPAYHYHGEDGTDFLHAPSTERALSALRILRSDPALYHSLRQRGQLRAEQFTAQRTGERWETLFRNVILPEYALWTRQSVKPLRRAPRRIWQFVRRRLRGHTAGRGFDLDGCPMAHQASTRRRLASAVDRILTALERPSPDQCHRQESGSWFFKRVDK